MRQVELDIESWPLLEPFEITGHTWTHCDVLVVSITENRVTGRGEANGVYYLDETAESMCQQALSIQQKLEQDGESYADMREELAYKREGMLEILDDEDRFRQAQRHYSDLNLVLDAVEVACTQAL